MRLQTCLVTMLLGVQLASAAAMRHFDNPPPRKMSRAQREPVKWKGGSSTAVLAVDPAGAKEKKYFHEPGTAAAGHYDKRYFTGFVSDTTRQKALKHLIKAWLRWTQEREIETWLAHGTLLGWWWNTRILPWDTDLDVQVSEGTMEKLALEHNMTTWDIHFDDDDYRATYLLDINPHWVNRLRGHSANLIDGRWIDKKTGLFIDITALSETHPIQRPGMINCKNLHRYNINDIWPLRDVKFENITARVPWAYDKILVKEYRGKAFTATEFEKHEWQPALQSWIPKASNQPSETYTLKNGKTIKIKREDPRGLETVPLPTFFETISRAIHYW